MTTLVALTLKFLAEGATEGAIGTILKAPVIAAFDGLYRVAFKSARRSQKLAGVWTGIVKQTIGGKEGEYKLALRFERKKGSASLVGRGLLWPAAQGNSPKLKNIDPLVFAASAQGDRLRIDFWNADSDKVQFGTIIADLTGSRSKFDGTFAAIAITDKKPAAGSVSLVLQQSVLDIDVS